MFCIEFHVVTKRSQMHPDIMQHTKTWVYGPMGWIGCVSWKKSRRDFVARTFALIAPIHTVLHRVSCSSETIPNAPKHYAMHQNMSLGSNGVDWVSSAQKIPMWLRGTNFCINCSSWPRFAPSFMQLRNDPKWPKHYETHQNISLGCNGVDQVHWLWKITTWLRGTNFCINCTSSVCFATSFMQLRNEPKCTDILRNGLKL